MYVIEFALDNGADPNLVNSKKQTPLMISAGNGRVSIVNTLIQHNADLNISDIDGKTALHYCCLYNKYEIAKILIQNGASIKQDKSHQTPIDHCPFFERPKYEKLFQMEVNINSPRSNQASLSTGGKLSFWHVFKPPMGQKCNICKKTFFSKTELRGHECKVKNQ